ncbi:replication factor A protein 2 [Lunasporangiospora selenospora]|uniref:Replication factor A protein 2 n=1 Tax=Lunasporangiospora selenospora TaxID=979761 RepID=A0A9P6KHT8_9FUNG|nr:replication factor A protein 2 [Lunasporangiospora selenospora]
MLGQDYRAQTGATGQGYVEDSFSSDPATALKVTFIGVVRNSNKQSTQHMFTIDDGTGSIDARRFLSEEDSPSEENTIIEGKYVRVVGLLKEFNQRFSVNIHTIRPVTDMNELTYHNLEVIFVHVSATRQKSSGGMSGVMSTSAYAGQNQPNYNTARPSSSSRNMDVGAQIVDMIQNHPDAKTGVHRMEITKRFAAVAGSPDAVNAMLESMISEGDLYTGEDYDHFLSSY